MSSPSVSGIVVYVSSVAGSVAVEKNTERVLFLLDAQKASYTKVDVSISESDKEYMHAHSGNKNKNLLPQVFVNGEYVGAKDEIDEANEVGELKALLKL